MRKVAVLSYGMTKVDKHWRKSLRELYGDAAKNALSSVSIPSIDALIVGNMCASDLSDQNNIGALLADYLGITPSMAYRIEAACGSGGAAILGAYTAVASGLYDYVLTGGVEKLTDGVGGNTTYSLGKASDAEYELFYGSSFVSINALMMNRYMHLYRTPREAFADFAVLMHKNATKNPCAQLPFEISRETVLNSDMISDPISLYDCAPVGDGAAALILCPVELAKKITDSYVEVAGIAGATDTLNISSRSDILTLNSTREAAKKAYRMANVSAADIDVAEIHDTFTITAALSVEDLGFCEKGRFGKMLSSGEMEAGGKVVINPSGGLKARGHPVGTTGAYQVAEIAMQLSGKADRMQVKDAEIGLAQNIGGSGSSTYVTILRRP